MFCDERRLLLPVKSLATLLTCLACAAAAQEQSVKAGGWMGTWAAAPIAAASPAGYLDRDRTLREIVHVSVGGARLRIVLSNEFGTGSLTVGGAQVALSPSHGAVPAGTSLAVTFNGHSNAIIPAGALAVSDPVALKLPALSDLAVSLFLPRQKLETLTVHEYSDSTNYEAGGDQMAAAILTEPQEVESWRFLKGVEVESAGGKGPAGAIVALGDSITDGAGSARDANARWPDVLAQRLQADPATARLAMLNAGIGGNRILHDGTGPNALARFDRDVLAQPGVRYVIVLEGVNDLGRAADPRSPNDLVSAGDLIAGLSQMATRAHIRGLKIFGATLTPYVGAGYHTPAGEQMRQVLNQWIRTTRELDGVIDFDKATADPAHPGVFLPQDDSGDHLHPSGEGHKAMGNAIDLKLFSK